MTISYIVPVYNVKSYLELCVNSLFKQGLEDFSYEIILVNDGSTDGSEALCRKLADKHPSVRVISQNNKGLSEARNYGILEARGDYLCFVDADDELAPDSIVKLLGYCDGRFDLIRFECELRRPMSQRRTSRGSWKVSFQGDGSDYLRQYGLETFCVRFLYKRSFLAERKLFFTPDILGEDFSFMYDVMSAEPRIISLDRIIYIHNSNPNSISTTRAEGHSRRWVTDLMSTMDNIMAYISEKEQTDRLLYDRCRQSLDDKMIALISRMLTSGYSIDEFREKIVECREKKLLPFYSKPVNLKERNHRLVVYLLAKHPALHPVARLFFIHFFLPYIYPRIEING